MERRIPLIIAILFFIIAIHAVSQEVTQAESIQILLWADLDAYPEVMAEEKQKHPNDTVFSYPVRRLKQLAPYLITGMVYGWDFDYVPSDKMRAVEEFFEVKEKHPLGDDYKRIVYKTPWLQDNRMYCWVEFKRTPYMLSSLHSWESIVHPNIRGMGEGSVYDGFDGITQACQQAVKDAVRNYFRSIEKNKPKELRGSVLLRKIPRLVVDSGHYVVELDFFIETSTIIKYKQY
ncbi:MAG: hypothetical protein K6E51_13085 [Treponema sp.]|nr:hypothetical protein [Treponema sp.]